MDPKMSENKSYNVRKWAENRQKMCRKGPKR